MRTQDVRSAGTLLLLLLLVASGCQRARQYGGPPKAAKSSPSANDDLKVPEPSYHVWRESKKESWDIPIVFVPATAAEWADLPHFWNLMPRFGAAAPVAFLGTSPLLVPALRLLEPVQIKVKVPLGLPDPTPHIPPGNPLTFGKWKLGKELFFDEIVQVQPAERLYACAMCHDPKHGFAENAAIAQHMNRNAPSLINVVYNRQQFWDGRADVLEAAILRDAADTKDAGKKHNFLALAKSLRASAKYRKRFEEVFGIIEPTQDAAAKALATYMRTILSGNSVFDRAERERGRHKGLLLTPDHFKAVLAADDIAALGRGTLKDTVERLEEGYRLYTGKANCVACHPLNGVFTDHDFHNIGLRQEDNEYDAGNVEGRFTSVPIGLKERRLVGAFRTPGLRALPRTGPYMHDGTKESLEKVVEHFNSGVKTRFNSSVARPLLAGPDQPRLLNLDEREARALATFLQALDGDAVDPIVSRPPDKTQP